MSTFDDASLVFIPSGYKTSKAYSVKPTDGTGDLAFTRSNDTATRVASSGLIEKVRTNVVTYSQDFSDASWTKTAITISTSATANPVNGALTAQDAIPTAVSSSHRIFKLAGLVSAANTWSIFAKAKGYNFITIAENGNTSASVSFNLSTGAVSTQTSAVGQIQSLGNGWYRCSMIHTTSTTPRFDVYVSPTDSLASYTGDGTSGVTLFGAQAEASDFGPTPYIATTTAAVSVGPVANVPRLDYLGSTCPKLILEGQRTNLFTFSEQINNAAWLNAGGTTTANTAVSPSGYQDADTLTGVRYQATFASNTYTLSAFAKKVDGDGTFVLRFDAPTTKVAVFNLNNGTIVSTDAGYTSTITAYGNGWYRCTFTSPASTTIANAVFVSANAGVSSTYVWGCQLEVGSYATSYIPTLGAAVTRGADAASKTGISSLIGVNGGSIFVEFDANGLASGVANYIFDLSDGTNFDQNRIAMYWTGVNDLSIFYAYGGTTASVTYTFNFLTTKKVAVRWTSTQIQVVVNGVAQTAVTYGNSSPTKLNIGSRFNNVEYLASNVKQCLLFNNTLTTAQLQELTTI